MPWSPEENWLQEQMARNQLSQYEGSWIAVKDDTILESSTDFGSLINTPAVQQIYDFSPFDDEDERIAKVPLFYFVMPEEFQ